MAHSGTATGVSDTGDAHISKTFKNTSWNLQFAKLLFCINEFSCIPRITKTHPMASPNIMVRQDPTSIESIHDQWQHGSSGALI